MKYITASSDMVSTIYNILYTTIKTIYPQYYPKEVLDFFYKTVGHGIYELENNVKLVYEIMEKKLKRN